MEKELLRSHEAKRVTFLGFGVNAVLTIIKIATGIIGKSNAMVADGIHSLSDFTTDILVLVGFKLTEKPEDDCHNYGHDKYETLVTTIIAVFLGIVGFQILKSGVINIISAIQGKEIPKPGVIALVAAVLSIIAKELLFHFTLAVGKRINSSAIIANAWHQKSDVLSSIGTLLGIGGAVILGNGWTVLDPIASVIVSMFIFKVAFEILMPSINELMEIALSDEEKNQIEELLSETPEIKSYHKLRTRRLGTKAVIESHILVNNTLDIKEAHAIATEIEYKLKVVFGESSIVTIHVEPYE